MNNNQLQFPRTKTFTGTRAFRCAAPQLWNSLPADIRSLNSLPVSAKNLKHLYTTKPIGIVSTSIRFELLVDNCAYYKSI